MARIPRRFSAAVSQVQDKLGGFSERFRASKKPQSSADSGAGNTAPESSPASEGGANPWQFTKSWFAKFFRPDNPSITLRVSLSGALVVLLFSLTSGAITFAVSYEQAQEAQDERLEEVVGMLARTKAAFSRQPPSFQAFFMDDDVFERQWLLDEDDPRAGLPAGSDVIIQTLHKNGRAVHARFRNFLPDGYHTMTLRRHQEYRILLRTLKNGAHVIAAERTSAVFNAATANSFNLVIPLTLLSLFLGFAIGWIVWRTMRPVKTLAREIGGRSGQTYAPVSECGVPNEILPLITAFNGLLKRVDALRGQEARFVADAGA